MCVQHPKGPGGAAGILSSSAKKQNSSCHTHQLGLPSRHSSPRLSLLPLAPLTATPRCPIILRPPAVPVLPPRLSVLSLSVQLFLSPRHAVSSLAASLIRCSPHHHPICCTRLPAIASLPLHPWRHPCHAALPLLHLPGPWRRCSVDLFVTFA